MRTILFTLVFLFAATLAFSQTYQGVSLPGTVVNKADVRVQKTYNVEKVEVLSMAEIDRQVTEIDEIIAELQAKKSALLVDRVLVESEATKVQLKVE